MLSSFVALSFYRNAHNTSPRHPTKCLGFLFSFFARKYGMHCDGTVAMSAGGLGLGAGVEVRGSTRAQHLELWVDW